VTIDFESGYGKLPAEIQDPVSKVIKAGAVGINFEDQVIGGEGLFSIADQCARIAAIRQIANDLSIPLFINARTDIFLKADQQEHNQEHLEEAIRRSAAYAESGASGFFAPGLQQPEFIEKLCRLSPLPVNILMRPGVPSSKRLAELGVARISHGPYPYRQMIAALKEAASRVMEQ
jgi:2-methylisocitrate lyase-like PEP mutase family enzyme